MAPRQVGATQVARWAFSHKDTKGTKNLSSQDNSPNSLLQYRHVEVNEQPNTASGGPHVGQNLRNVDWVDLFDCLYFHYESFVDQQIEPVMAKERVSVAD